MGFLDGLRKKGRPRKHFTVEESEAILKSTLGRVIHSEIYWETHKRVSDTIFTVTIDYLSLTGLDLLLNHRNIRDVYFSSDVGNTGRMSIKLVYR
jgi:hypothetical protein